MNKLLTYIKQAWQLMKQNRFYTAVYIAGTGLAISLVMVIAIVYHVKTADIAPEVNRNRMLLNERGSAKKKEKGGQYNWALSYRTLKECFYNLETPECVAASVDIGQVRQALGNIYLSIPGSEDKHTAYLGCTDANYWKVFRYSFLEGKPFSTEEFESGFKKAILTETMAKKIYGEKNIIGKSLLINDIEYTIGAVVKDVTPVMKITFADLWIPYTSIPVFTAESAAEDIVGYLKAYILAYKTSDFDAIRKELEEKRKQYNTSKTEYEFILKDGIPFTQRQVAIKEIDYSSSNEEIIRRFLLVALVFLLVPAVNLSGLTSSRMQERISEMGIRKAFGARRNTLINQVLTENLFLTLLGGVAGLIISYMIVWGLSSSLFMSKYSQMATDAALSPGMLLNFTVFFYAFMICVLLNLFSSLIPVWNMSRKNIVEAINDK